MEREPLLKLILQQLQYFDMDTLAAVLAESAHLPLVQNPSNQLATLASLGLEHYQPESLTDMEAKATPSVDATTMETLVQQPTFVEDYDSPCLDITAADSSVKIQPAQSVHYQTTFLTVHKNPVNSACFNADGRYAACGSSDFSLKVLQVDKMRQNNSSNNNSNNANMEDKPLIRTFYDHTGPVNDVCFHSNTRVLASCSDDMTIKLYDLQRVGVKRGFRFLQDTFPVKSVAFHPCGEFLMAATLDNSVHMFDVNYMKCFTPSATDSKSHTLGINQIRFQHQGKVYVTAGEEGDVKLWDSVSSVCIQTISEAHLVPGGALSACLSANGKYVLSSGIDGPKLWDSSSGRLLMSYKLGSKSVAGRKACFNWNEDFVIGSDDHSSSVVVWCARTGNVVERLSGHSADIFCVAASPTRDDFISGSQDNRARFWTDSSSKNLY